MATHSSILAWEILWTEESGRLQSMGLQRVRHNRVIEQILGIEVGIVDVEDKQNITLLLI